MSLLKQMIKMFCEPKPVMETSNTVEAYEEEAFGGPEKRDYSMVDYLLPREIRGNPDRHRSVSFHVMQKDLAVLEQIQRQTNMCKTAICRPILLYILAMKDELSKCKNEKDVKSVIKKTFKACAG